jgi:iron(III) transport system substrate-binding protein
MSRKSARLVLAALGLATTLGFACQSVPPTTSQSAAPPVPPLTTDATTPDWQQQWDRLVQAAKQEGKLVLYTQPSEAFRTRVAGRFQERFGIEVEIIAGLNSDLVPKVILERSAGLYTGDVWYGTGSTLANELLPTGALEPVRPAFILPEINDPSTWVGGRLPYMDEAEIYLPAAGATPTGMLTYNSQLVAPAEVPYTLEDLLHPRWQGKLGALEIGRPGDTWAPFLYAIGREDFLRELARRRIPMLAVQTYGRDVAQGKYLVVVGFTGPQTQPLIQEGLPIGGLTAFRDVGGPVGRASSTVALANGAPRPNAARLFANWIYTQEGATLASQAYLHDSLRKDVPNDHLPEWRRLDDQLYVEGRYFDHHSVEFLKREAQIRDTLTREIFAY